MKSLRLRLHAIVHLTSCYLLPVAVLLALGIAMGVGLAATPRDRTRRLAPWQEPGRWDPGAQEGTYDQGWEHLGRDDRRGDGASWDAPARADSWQPPNQWP